MTAKHYGRIVVAKEIEPNRLEAYIGRMGELVEQSQYTHDEMHSFLLFNLHMPENERETFVDELKKRGIMRELSMPGGRVYRPGPNFGQTRTKKEPTQ